MQYLLMIVGVVLVALFISLVRGTRRCELCGAPRDPKSAIPGTWKHGVRACDDCGRELDEMYGDGPPDTPPFWP